MRRLIAILILLAAIFLPSRAQAQDSIHLSSVSVDIMPEYDQPSVLVIYHMALASEVALPATLNLHIPVDAQVNAVAIMDPAQDLLNAPYERTVQEDWALLTITANSRQVQVEYYSPLVKNENVRHIVYNWAGDYPVDLLEVNFILPLGAQNVIFNPVPLRIGTGQDGLISYRYQTTQLAIGEAYTLMIDYQRQTDDVSIAGLPVEAVSPPGEDTAGRVAMAGAMPWILAAAGALLIVVGVIGFALWQRSPRTKKAIRPQRASRREQAAEDPVYCQRCGKRAQPGDMFCRTCGLRLKREAAD